MPLDALTIICAEDAAPEVASFIDAANAYVAAENAKEVDSTPKPFPVSPIILSYPAHCC